MLPAVYNVRTMKPNTKTLLAADKLTASSKKKKEQDPAPMAGLTVTGAGLEPHTPAPVDPLAGLSTEERSAYCLESLLYYAQQAAERRSPYKKGIYFLLAFSPLALLGLHKFYIGKVWSGLLIQFFCALFGVFSFGWALPVALFILDFWAGWEAARDGRGRPLLDAEGRKLQ